MGGYEAAARPLAATAVSAADTGAALGQLPAGRVERTDPRLSRAGRRASLAAPAPGGDWLQRSGRAELRRAAHRLIDRVWQSQASTPPAGCFDDSPLDRETLADILRNRRVAGG